MPLWSTPHETSERVYECRGCGERVRDDHTPVECSSCGGTLRAVHAATSE